MADDEGTGPTDGSSTVRPAEPTHLAEPACPAEPAHLAEPACPAEPAHLAEPLATAGSRQRVVVLAGPSGSGKSRLAARLNAAHGWPIFRLDDFYRDEDDPSMPRSDDLGIIDWDHPDSWDADRAVASLCELVDTGRTDTPVYDISTSRAVGHHLVTAAPADLVVAEGIFAAEVVDRLRACGVLHSAWCVHHRPAVTFVRRLARDLKEHRKPPATLVRRGLTLMRAEPEIVRRQTALGARAVRASELERRLAASLV